MQDIHRHAGRAAVSFAMTRKHFGELAKAGIRMFKGRSVAQTAPESRLFEASIVDAMVLSAVLIFAGPSALAGEPYENGFPSNPSFFPIGVYLQSPARASNYKAIGINTFVGLWEGPTEVQLAELAKYDMFVIATQNDIGLKSVSRKVIKGWLGADEPDNAQPIGLGIYGPCIPSSEVARRTREIKANDGTRPVMVNFGQGIANEFWRGRGRCTGDQKYYDIAIQDADILAFDIYPVGSSISQVKGKLEYVARGVTSLVQRAMSGQSVWAILETTSLDPPNRVMPAQVRTEVWMSLIHGANGIVYFVHEFSPKLREDAIFRYPDVVEEVAKTNQLIMSLAPVLNSPNVPGNVVVTSSVPIATMVKRHENTLYIFAVAMRNDASTPRFAIGGIGETQAVVIGEGRSVTVTQGTLEDPFEGYGVHLYKIPLNKPAN